MPAPRPRQCPVTPGSNERSLHLPVSSQRAWTGRWCSSKRGSMAPTQMPRLRNKEDTLKRPERNHMHVYHKEPRSVDPPPGRRTPRASPSDVTGMRCRRRRSVAVHRRAGDGLAPFLERSASKLSKE
eukprot:gene18173-biopygen18948